MIYRPKALLGGLSSAFSLSVSIASVDGGDMRDAVIGVYDCASEAFFERHATQFVACVFRQTSIVRVQFGVGRARICGLMRGEEST